ncbi:MAG: RlmE family RNA methyltransferase [Phycisphaerales bacterium]
MPKRVLHDQYFKKAKAEGYLARSAYKLLEIQERRGIIKPGMAVLDLGCAPGSWLQVAAELVGEEGLVAGIDLSDVREPMPPCVVTMRGDFTTLDAATLLEPVVGWRGQEGGGEDADKPALYDVVISDMAPNTSGAGDHYKSVRLCEAILERLPDVLRPGGGLVYKVFEGESYPDLVKRTGAMFSWCRGLKPRATREVSTEMFVMATGYEPALGRLQRPEGVAPPPPKPGKGWGGGGA